MVMEKMVSGLQMIIGMDIIRKLGGVRVGVDKVKFACVSIPSLFVEAV